MAGKKWEKPYDGPSACVSTFIKQLSGSAAAGVARNRQRNARKVFRMLISPSIRWAECLSQENDRWKWQQEVPISRQIYQVQG